ncbi:MAG: hypothetical protein MO852_12320 [Candidatus Devosia euplotis]|nr:hypothetical protein [Candidatus Devosia euplotis]
MSIETDNSRLRLGLRMKRQVKKNMPAGAEVLAIVGSKLDARPPGLDPDGQAPPHSD